MDKPGEAKIEFLEHAGKTAGGRHVVLPQWSVLVGGHRVAYLAKVGEQKLIVIRRELCDRATEMRICEAAEAVDGVRAEDRKISRVPIAAEHHQTYEDLGDEDGWI